MSKGDFSPYRGWGEYAPMGPPLYGRIKAAETVVQGEPVYGTSGGEISESGDDPTAVKFMGFIASSGDTVGATDALGTFRQKPGMFTPGATPNLPVAGDLVEVWRPAPGQAVRARVFATDGAGTPAVPTAAHIYDMAGFTLAAGVYSLDVGTTNKLARIVDVLDANDQSILRSGLAGVTAIFEIVAHEFNVTTDPSA